jgi:hypothetical protein
VEDLHLANFTFSTFPEDMGVTFEMRSKMSMTNQMGAMMKGVFFDIETFIPFGYNQTSCQFLPGNASEFEFKLEGHVDHIKTTSNHILKDTDVFVHVKHMYMTVEVRGYRRYCQPRHRF